MGEQSLKEKVASKLNLAGDIKEAKIQTSVGDVRKVDGKISARFEISGLPSNKEYSDSYKTIPKIFDTVEKFSEYVTIFFNASDDEIIKMCRGSNSSGPNKITEVKRY